jgi:hypothetical protein
VQIERQDRSGLAAIQPHVTRTCSNGEAVGTPKRSSETTAQTGDTTASLPAASRAQGGPSTGALQGQMMQGNTLGFGLRDAGASTTTPRR